MSAQAERKVGERQATQSAFTYFQNIFPRNDPLRQVSDPRLEEIEMSKDRRFWLVTLGFSEPRPNSEMLPKFLQVPMRKLKTFKVDAATGQVLSMKIPKEE